MPPRAQWRLGLDRLLWVLTPDPPHKQEQVVTPVEHRLAMVNLAIADNPSFELSRVELDRPGPHYTLETIEAISDQYPDADITPILGGDSLRDLPTWHKPRELLYASHWVGVMRRPGEQPDLENLENELPGIRLQEFITWMHPCSRSPLARSAVGSRTISHSSTMFRSPSVTISSSTSSTSNLKFKIKNPNSPSVKSCTKNYI